MEKKDLSDKIEHYITSLCNALFSCQNKEHFVPKRNTVEVEIRLL